MSKKRAFVRYTKSGEIVPGSLIITTNGGYPDKSSLWKEIQTNECCDGGGNCSPIAISTTCESFNFPSPAVGIFLTFRLNVCPGFVPFNPPFINIVLGIESPVSSVQDVVDLINSNPDCQENGITAVIDGDCINISLLKCKCLYTNFAGISSVTVLAVYP